MCYLVFSDLNQKGKGLNAKGRPKIGSPVLILCVGRVAQGSALSLDLKVRDDLLFAAHDARQYNCVARNYCAKAFFSNGFDHAIWHHQCGFFVQDVDHEQQNLIGTVFGGNINHRGH